MFAARFVNAVKRRDRATDATHPEIHKHPYGSRPAFHHLVDRHVRRERALLHAVSLDASSHALVVREQTEKTIWYSGKMLALEQEELAAPEA